MTDKTIDRRDFLRGAAAAVAMVISVDELIAAEPAAEVPKPAAGTDEKPVAGPPVKIGVIGLGLWGKDLVTTLARLPSAQVSAICDTYEPYLKRAAKSAPAAASLADYRKLLESPEVEAVVIATPSHQHKDIALAAIQAGKHVYCEAPLAVTIEEAREIAKAGAGPSKVFQVGQQGRSNALHKHVEKFVRTGCLGTVAQAHAQWNKRNSWRRAAPTPEREREANWRLSRATSAGLLGEVGVHQIDMISWYLNGLPVAASGFAGILGWNDGRDVPDTVECVLEYPNNVKAVLTATLASSFSGEYTLFQGTYSTLMMREKRGWMVKEADSPLLGWEVYARKEQCYDETGICMIADATKILKAGKEPAKEGSVEPEKDAVYLALESFTRSIREGAKVACGPVEGYQAAVAAIRANEAVLSGNRIAYQKEWFELG